MRRITLLCSLLRIPIVLALPVCWCLLFAGCGGTGQGGTSISNAPVVARPIQTPGPIQTPTYPGEAFINLATGSSPTGIAAGPDGYLWFTESAGSAVVKLSPITGHMSVYPTKTPRSGPGAITAGPDGSMWFTEAGKIGKITMSGVVSEFSIPTAGSVLSGIAAGPDGNVWFTEFVGMAGKIGKISPTGRIHEFAVPAGPTGIAAGPDGNMWYADGNIGKMTLDGRVTEYTVPGDDALQLAPGPDGNMWFTEFDNDWVGKITPAGEITGLYPTSYPAEPNSITTGPDGNLWFTESFWGIAKISTNGTLREYDLRLNSPPPGCQCQGPPGAKYPAGNAGLAVGTDRNIWFTQELLSRIVKFPPNE